MILPNNKFTEPEHCISEGGQATPISGKRALDSDNLVEIIAAPLLRDALEALLNESPPPTDDTSHTAAGATHGT